MRKTSWPWAVGAFGLALASQAQSANVAPGVRECALRYESAIAAKGLGKFVDARAKFLSCAVPTCREDVRTACDDQYEKIERAIPTVVFVAKDSDDRDLDAVAVSVDQTPLLQVLSGRAHRFDPGAHLFSFTYKGMTLDRHVLLREGEKNRLVSVVFPSASTAPTPLASASASSSSSGLTSAAPKAPAPSQGPPVAAWTLGAVGVLGLASFGVLGVLGLQDESRLRARCAPTCSRTDADRVLAQYIGANVALGVGIVSLGLATYLFLTRDKGTRQTMAIDVVADPRGGTAVLRGHFY